MPDSDPVQRDSQSISQRAFDSVPIPTPLPPGWSVVLAEGSLVEEAERLEYDVFVEIGFCEPSTSGRAEEFDPWRDASRFKVVLDSEGRPQGVARELFGNYDDLPIGTFPRYEEYPPDPVMEYASITVSKDVRRGGVAECLYRTGWQDAVRFGASGLVAIGADWAFAILNGTFDLGFRQLGPGRYYMGGDCLPMGTSMTDLIERLRNQPSFFRWGVEEIDLRELSASEFRSAVATALEATGDRRLP